MAIMESKREGTCNTCRGKILVGELIEWDRKTGARHYPKANPGCAPVTATEEERKAYTKALVDQVKAWDGVGSFSPMPFGDWVHSTK